MTNAVRIVNFAGKFGAVVKPGFPCTIKFICITDSRGGGRRIEVDHGSVQTGQPRMVVQAGHEHTFLCDVNFPRGAFIRRPGSGSVPHFCVGIT